MSFGLAALRALVGGLFIGHGTQKLFGWFGGHGPDATGQAFESMGLRPGKQNALAAGAAEAGGGALLALGLFTPAAAAALTGTMVTAIGTVHAPRGPWVTDGGWEYNGVLIAAVTAIVEAGPGRLSLDAARGRERWGSGWALASVAAGAAGAAFVLSRRETEPPAPEEPAPADAPA
ncbi:DoxX family protein [Conexibacter sp. JD483]|uniref:DoxX family protein n=1 Tax=unclassified Conexibacter TaxID=2627773 RepID=UPI002716CE09|nr:MULTISPECIES: DoxX family protein [unclassified Conexibacter]MDO8189103.1 DoxX family protein [Conexibacter sp. CPCC 205706]MDO8200849.1 DoxX family protein [Conexibacter sp. CPCC 205762]MDR9371718.1 DoxX family protein [Conexibacter sp. JD483]